MQKVSIKSSNKLGELPVYVSPNESKHGVVVLQEWWGANAYIIGRAEWFSTQGFIGLVPDLYRGEVATDHERAGHLRAGLDWEGAMQDVQAAVDYLKDVRGCEKVSVVGFCMGGALALSSAVKVNGLSASSVFYGVCDSKQADPAEVKIPVQCHFGTKDPAVGFSDPPTQDALEATLKKAGATFEFYRYEGADHAFANETRADKYNPEYCKQALGRTVDFFKKYMENQ